MLDDAGTDAQGTLISLQVFPDSYTYTSKTWKNTIPAEMYTR